MQRLQLGCGCAIYGGGTAVIVTGLFLSESPGELQLTICAVATIASILLGYAVESSLQRQRKADALDEARCRAWQCPNCGATYGADSMFVRSGGKDPQYFCHCVLVCASCNYLNCFDSSGRAKFGRGELFVPDEDTIEPLNGMR